MFAFVACGLWFTFVDLGVVNSVVHCCFLICGLII